MRDKLDWETDGRNWPNRAASRFVDAAGLRWHVQVMGDHHPILLLVHGTGASTHSWRALLPLLAERFTVIAPDLPGHGFTATPAAASMTLPGMARGLAALLRTLGMAPNLVIGHSAGAAILARMCLDGLIAPRALVSVNGALLPLPEMPAELFAPVARILASFPMVSRIAARQAGSPKALDRLIRGTGSTLDVEGTALYGRLVGNPGHVAGALSMMGNWRLRPLAQDLPKLTVPLTLVVGEADRTIAPGETLRVQRLVPSARIIRLPGLGHLAHEEQPARVVEIIEDVAATAGVT